MFSVDMENKTFLHCMNEFGFDHDRSDEENPMVTSFPIFYSRYWTFPNRNKVVPSNVPSKDYSTFSIGSYFSSNRNTVKYHHDYTRSLTHWSSSRVYNINLEDLLSTWCTSLSDNTNYWISKTENCSDCSTNYTRNPYCTSDISSSDWDCLFEIKRVAENCYCIFLKDPK